MDKPPELAVALARLLKDAGWTVRRLRDEASFGTTTAVRLIDPEAKGAASTDSLARALALVGRELWHRAQK